jgi:probable biosynthetic protein (TIGR04098 family)
LSMYCEATELTYSHQDLGPLNEFGLMSLFGSMHSKALVQGLEHTVEEIVDLHGRKLYPAYFHTHLKVPPSCLLSQFRAWRQVHLGVQVKTFGKCYLDSSYVIKPAQEGRPVEADFASSAYPAMHGNSLFIVDVSEDASVARQLAVPQPDCLARMDRVAGKPIAIQRAKEVSQTRVVHEEQAYPLASRESISYTVVPGRDAVDQHAMIFARFCQVMDCAEFVFLTEQLRLPMTRADLLEREIFYYGNAHAGDIIEIGVKGRVTSPSDDDRADMLLETEYQLYRHSNLDLLAVAYARKSVKDDDTKQSLKSLL